MANKIYYAMYDDDHKCLDGAKKLVGEGVHVADAFSPFPIHGIDPVIGVQHTRLGICAFLYGITGTMLAIFGIKYFMISDWPMIVGGKDSYSFPVYIPVIFELTVLFCALGMVGTFIVSNGMGPSVKPLMFDLRTTDNKFAMAVDLSKNGLAEGRIEQILKDSGAAEVNVKQF